MPSGASSSGRYGEIWGDMGRYGEIYLLVLLHQLVDVVVLALLDLEDLHLGRCREMQGGVGRCREVWGGAGRRGQVWAGVGRCGQVWGGVGRCGEVWQVWQVWGSISTFRRSSRSSRSIFIFASYFFCSSFTMRSYSCSILVMFLSFSCLRLGIRVRVRDGSDEWLGCDHR